MGVTTSSGMGTGYSISANGVAQLPNGVAADLTTREGMAQAEAALDPALLGEMRNLMRGLGFKLSEGVFIPSDSYGAAADTSAVSGPQSTRAGRNGLDAEVAALFTAGGVPDPYNANTTPGLLQKLGNTESFAGAVQNMDAFVQNPTAENRQAAATGVLALGAGGINVMEALYLVFRESIRDNNEDKKYFLAKLQEYNKMADALSDYLHYLTDRSRELSEKSRGKGEPQKVTIPIETRHFDISTLDETGNVRSSVTTKGSGNLNREALNDVIKDLENQQEDVRNRRQMATTAFQGFDQKGNQYMNQLASVIKTMNEMRSIGAGSRAGL